MTFASVLGVWKWDGHEFVGDLDTLTTFGTYQVATESGSTHLPPDGGYFIVLVYRTYWIAQVAFNVISNTMFFRSSAGSLAGVTWVQL